MSGGEGTGEVGTRKAVTVAVILEEYCPSSYQRGISHNHEGFGDIRDLEYQGRGEDGFEFVEGSLLERGPVPRFSLSGEEV